ncbi:branched-chain amino acid ABC transporter permease [Cellulomonas fimi]|uniref:branched-chain amino acid ABC transporter permease n=1 Tax=Cellulomonas fimi TaxID=1708 RepID=UPI00234CBF50|nr:branched-chain amino acid ABC transporter permease [Cellulomonas fimi]MDC7123554.1 branched-chain amino acid ABC transporter permease [Cellulomonas fimi]
MRLLPTAGPARVLVVALLGTLGVIAGTFALDPYRNYQLALVAAYLCATAGLTVLVGLSGQLSLGHSALMAAGGYGYALTASALADAPGVARVLAGLVGAVMVSGAVGLLLGLAGARLHGPYLAGLTLTLVVALPAVASTVPGLGGDQGVRAPLERVPDALDRVIALEQWHAWVATAVAAAVLGTLHVLARGRTGLRMRAVRDDATAAALAGIAPDRTKVLAFVVASTAAGLGGAVLVLVTQSVTPGGYGLATSLLLLVAVVVGGLGSLAGAAVGAVLVVLLPWLVATLVDALPVPDELAQRLDGNLALLVFGLALVVLMAAAPAGVVGTWRAARARRTARRTAGTDPSTSAHHEGSHR